MTDTPRLTNYRATDSELVFYCPECAEREFGESVSAAFGLTSSSSLRGHRTLDLGCAFRPGFRPGVQPHG